MKFAKEICVECAFIRILQDELYALPHFQPLLYRGRILVQADEKEDIVYADVGEWLTMIERVRQF